MPSCSAYFIDISCRWWNIPPARKYSWHAMPKIAALSLIGREQILPPGEILRLSANIIEQSSLLSRREHWYMLFRAMPAIRRWWAYLSCSRWRFGQPVILYSSHGQILPQARPKREMKFIVLKRWLFNSVGLEVASSTYLDDASKIAVAVGAVTIIARSHIIIIARWCGISRK